MTSIIMSMAMTVSVLEITTIPAYAASEVCSTTNPPIKGVISQEDCVNKKSGKSSTETCTTAGNPPADITCTSSETTQPKDEAKSSYSTLKEECRNPDPNQTCEKSNP